jgi:hypothetical protein
MHRQVRLNLAESGSHLVSAAPGEEPNFEAIFQVPTNHRLIAVRSRSRGGLEWSVYWEHEEYSPSGQLVARYVSFDQMNVAGQRQRGWRKFDGAGKLVRSGSDLRWTTHHAEPSDSHQQH